MGAPLEPEPLLLDEPEPLLELAITPELEPEPLDELDPLLELPVQVEVDPLVPVAVPRLLASETCQTFTD